MKKIIPLLTLILLLPAPTHARDGRDLAQTWDGPGPAEPQQTAEPEQPDSLPPIGFPWTAAGQNDAGYCPLVYGWGWTGSLLWPVEGFTALRPFGHLPGTTHGGLDLSIPFGTPVYSPVSGTVVWSGGNSAGFGNQETGLVAIASSGRVVILAHLSGVVEGLGCGDGVTAGQLIGWSGGPGFGAVSEGFYHLHIEVRWNGLAWNPMLWLD